MNYFTKSNILQYWNDIHILLQSSDSRIEPYLVKSSYDFLLSLKVKALVLYGPEFAESLKFSEKSISKVKAIEQKLYNL